MAKLGRVQRSVGRRKLGEALQALFRRQAQEAYALSALSVSLRVSSSILGMRLSLYSSNVWGVSEGLTGGVGWHESLRGGSLELGEETIADLLAGALRSKFRQIVPPTSLLRRSRRGVGDAHPAEFSATLEDPDFYSEAELVEMLEARYGRIAGLRPAGAGQGAAPRNRDTPEQRAIRRKGRLVLRQLETLRRLESLAASRPVPADAVASWLQPLTVQRLGTVGVLTLADLMLFIRLHGYRWYRKVPRLGELGAGRLVNWLGQYETTLGAVAATALVPLSQIGPWLKEPPAQVAVVPIERLRLPAALSGQGDSNRALPERCRARARNDYQAVTEWLELRRPTEGTGNGHTFRAYRKETERFLLWAVFEHEKALSSLDHVDCLAYRRFLGQIPEGWISSQGAPRWSERWLPFAGRWRSARGTPAEAIVTTMYAWLTDVRYLDSNPWMQVPRLNRPLPLQELRSLSDRQWALLETWLQALPETAANARRRMMFSLALATGMREVELAGARAGWLRHGVDGEGEPAWNLAVVGKGAKEREVPLTAKVAAQLAGHLASKSLGDDLAQVAPDVPLLSGLKDATRPLAPDRVYELMKAALLACAAAVEGEGDAKSARRIRQASPHWLRHTHGRKFVEAGGDRGVLRQNLATRPMPRRLFMTGRRPGTGAARWKRCSGSEHRVAVMGIVVIGQLRAGPLIQASSGLNRGRLRKCFSTIAHTDAKLREGARRIFDPCRPDGT